MGVAGDGAKRDKLHDLENVKRALILVFEDSSDLVIESIVAADVVAFKASDESQLQRTSRVAFRIHLYANDERIRALLMTHAPHILSHARELGLNARSLQVYSPKPRWQGAGRFLAADRPRSTSVRRSFIPYADERLERGGMDSVAPCLRRGPHRRLTTGGRACSPRAGTRVVKRTISLGVKPARRYATGSG